jgi:hypothetical protein
MLKRDMLITLHLRIRVVVTQELKMRVLLAREQASREDRRQSRLRQELISEDNPDLASDTRTAWVSFSPKSARKHTRRLPSADSGDCLLSDQVAGIDVDEETGDEDGDGSEDEDEIEEEREEAFVNWDDREIYLWPTMINDPGRATSLQRQWLSAMSEGKDPTIARRFEQCVPVSLLAPV